MKLLLTFLCASVFLLVFSCKNSGSGDKFLGTWGTDTGQKMTITREGKTFHISMAGNGPKQQVSAKREGNDLNAGSLFGELTISEDGKKVYFLGNEWLRLE